MSTIIKRRLYPYCCGEGFMMANDATEVVIQALAKYAESVGDEEVVKELVKSLSNCFETMSRHERLSVRPFRQDKEKDFPGASKPEWDYKDEVIERQLRCLRRITYSVGQLRAMLAPIRGINDLPSVKAIEDACSEGLDARRRVISEMLGADCEVPTEPTEKTMEKQGE